MGCPNTYLVADVGLVRRPYRATCSAGSTTTTCMVRMCFRFNSTNGIVGLCCTRKDPKAVENANVWTKAYHAQSCGKSVKVFDCSSPILLCERACSRMPLQVIFSNTKSCNNHRNKK